MLLVLVPDAKEQDVWHVVGGYWRGVKPGDAKYHVRWENDEEIRRFRDRAVRESGLPSQAALRQSEALAWLANRGSEAHGCRTLR